MITGPINTARDAAFYGDLILAATVRSLCSNIPEKLRHNTYHHLISNACIKRWDCGILSLKPCTKNKIPVNKSANMVEAWIYFIYVNYGEGAVKRYVINQIKKHEVNM